QRVLVAPWTELGQLQLVRSGALVLVARVVPLLAVLALERDDHAVSLRHDAYSTIFVTTPAPTVRPPSRMAKRSPSSQAIGVMSSTSRLMLSPGITISTPCGSVITPVTSVVRKENFGPYPRKNGVSRPPPAPLQPSASPLHFFV